MTGFLFNRKTIARHLAAAGEPSPEALAHLAAWASTIADGSIRSQSETAIEDLFKQRIVCGVLGYRAFNESGAWTVASKAAIGAGAVDLALGDFTPAASRIIAPFELKGARTRDLDAIMPGRAKTPVQQAWEYAADNVGTRWVLVSNYLEMRLYSYADGRQTYERFDLARCAEPEEAKRLLLLLSQDQLLGGGTAEILAQSRREDKDITDALYALYKGLRATLIGAVGEAAPDLDPLAGIGVAQTILDRVLFIAFAEDNGLLPAETLRRAFEHADPYNPRPVWSNFLGLFRAIDEGSDKLGIPRYNGGLFAPDPVIADLILPDAICEGFKELAAYDFASDVSVTVLGHIFEQSIADVEALQAEARGEAAPKPKATGTSGRRKRDGVVYTPDYVARFIVDQTLGAHEREMFAAILARHARPGATPDDEEIAWKSARAERAAWTEYRDALTALRIVDPACGSGVFLIMAFDWLKAALTRVNARLAELDGRGQSGDLYDPDSEILTHNLYGVDVNAESVEIAKLSLWIKTARRGKVLDSLDGNLKVGDSLIEDSSYAYREHGFSWREAFPEVFAQGGFDIVLGNPPYVRMELIKPMKPYLQARYEVVADRADLYAYFFERGVRLLKPGGRLGYISSSTFFKTGSGAPLRRFLRTRAAIETVVDFGDLQIFEGVTTYPVILTLRAGAPAEGHALRFWKIDALPEADFAAAYADAAEPFPQAALTDASWELEGDARRALRDKIIAGRRTLKEVYGSPLRGIVTGLNEAFVVDTPTKERLCRADPRSAELLRPWLEGKDLKRWRAEPRGLWVIYIPKNRIDIDNYPAIRDHLLPFREKLEKRATKQAWFELQQAQEAYSTIMDGPTIGYIDMAMAPSFSLQREQAYYANTGYFIAADDPFLVAVLNSPISWFFWGGMTTIARGGVRRLFTQHVENTPIPDASPEQRAALADRARAAQVAAEERHALRESITRRIADLAPDPAPAKLPKALATWWALPDFAAFRREVKKAFRADIPLAERTDWEDWLRDTRAQIEALDARIADFEVSIDAAVCALFELSEDDIALLQEPR
ncbi:MAG: type I restriction endonuclease subunit M [Citromicrobium sp.]|nr:MAG: type I restriction endonuclease subunit M [Citromicrobium sp.]